MSAFWDSCSSHNLCSSRLAAELINEGSTVKRDVRIPMRQGVLYTGVMTTRVWVPICIIHHGRKIEEEVEFFVWDMGADLTLSNAYLEDHQLLPASAGPNDDKLLQRQASTLPGFEPGHRAKGTGDQTEVVAIHNHIASELFDQRLLANGQAIRTDQTMQSSEGAETRESFGGELRVSSARRDAWTLEKALKLREDLQQQLRNPDPDVSRRLNEKADQYPEAFGTNIERPCRLKKFSVKLKEGAQFVALVPRRVSEPVLQEIKKQIAEMLEMGVIEPSSSPWAFPLVMVKRPGSSKLRMAIDYRLLNQMTVPYPYGMQDMHETLDMLVGKRFYWSVDISSYYWQIELSDESKELTAFVIPGGQKFQFTRVPFGLRSAPAWAQQQLKETLQADPTTAKLTNYLDDINFGSDDADECVQQFEDLLKFCIKHNIKLKREKCALGVPAIKALGCVVNAAGKWIDPDRVLALLKVPPARCVKELKSLLGSFGFVRQWLCHAATICAPLTDLLRRHSKFSWGPAQDAALEALKREVESSTCLGQLDPKLPIYIRPDASNVGCAAVLFQMVKVIEDGVEKEKPRAIAYTSRRFSPAEMKWSTAEGEAFAIKNAFCRFQSMIQGLPVIVESDHANHRFLYNAKSSAKIQRWRMFLEQFDYEVRHIPGNKNEISDGLSRLHMRNLMMTAPTNAEAEVERSQGIIAPSTYIAGVSQEDEPLKQVEDVDEDDTKGEGGLDEALFQSMQGGAISDYFEVEASAEASSKAADALWQELQDDDKTTTQEEDEEEKALDDIYGKGFRMLQRAGGGKGERGSREPWDQVGVRMAKDRRGLGAGGESTRTQYSRLNLTVAEEVTNVVREQIKRIHNDRVGHMGKLRTYRRLRQLPGFPWGQSTEALHTGVKEWCEGCMMCQKIWSLRGQPGAPGAAFIRQRPFTEVSLDLVVLKRADRDGNRYILNIMDSFSRFSELFPLKTGDAISVAECLFAVYNRYGRPRVLRADGAKAFHGSVVTAMNRMLAVENHVTLAYSPYQNGQNERQNQEICRHLRAMVMGDVLGVNSMMRWGTLTSAVQRILNNTVHGDLMCTPNELLLGGYGDSDMAMFQEDPAMGEGEEVSVGGYVRELEEAQFKLLAASEIHQEQRLSAAAEKASKEGPRQIQEGQYVLALRGGLGGRPKEKLQCKYTGPYLVIQRSDPNHSIVKCLHLATREVVELHMETLQICNMSHFRTDPTEAAKFAERDDWTYTVDRILQHRPTGPRRRRPKGAYEFEVLYKHIPRSTEIGDENPCFQPWENVKHLTALRDYCAQPSVRAELGEGFFVEESEEEA